MKRKKYYLEKMRHGQMTDEEVAKKFNTSVSNVRIAFIEYSKNKNPFRQKRCSFISIIEIIISIISMVLVFFTLTEMQTARNNAYIPDIYFNKTLFGISWDQNGLISSDILNDEMFEALSSDTEYINQVPEIELINIGMETAKNIHLEWEHNDNMEKLTDYLYSKDEMASFSYEFDNSMIFISSNDKIIGTTAKPSLDITYMLNEPQGDTILFPFEYFDCIRHICYSYEDGGLVLPDIKIMVQYLDIQGKKYCIEKTIRIQLLSLTRQPDNSGYAFFKIIEV